MNAAFELYTDDTRDAFRMWIKGCGCCCKAYLMAHLECVTLYVPDRYRWFACRAPIKACTNNYASIVGQFFWNLIIVTGSVKRGLIVTIHCVTGEYGTNLKFGHFILLTWFFC